MCFHTFCLAFLLQNACALPQDEIRCSFKVWFKSSSTSDIMNHESVEKNTLLYSSDHNRFTFSFSQYPMVLSWALALSVCSCQANMSRIAKMPTHSDLTHTTSSLLLILLLPQFSLVCCARLQTVFRINHNTAREEVEMLDVCLFFVFSNTVLISLHIVKLNLTKHLSSMKSCICTKIYISILTKCASRLWS